MHRGQKRIRFLDGLRGLSIMLVIVFHLYGPTYERLLPFGNRYASLPIITQGWVGVEMFFMISGFVIFLTLERCSGFRDFIWRRWRRLFPAMLAASLVLYAYSSLVDLPSPDPRPHWFDILPGLSFITPAVWHAVFHLPFRSLDGVFWSLYVEMAFYVVFGSLFFLVGWKRAVVGLLMCSVSLYARPVLVHLGAPYLVIRSLEPLEWCRFDLFGWFAAGILYAKAEEEKSSRLFALALMISLLAGLLYRSKYDLDLGTRSALFLVAIAFAAAQKIGVFQRILSSPIMLFAGFISYPLYLVHNNISLGLSNAIKRLAPEMPDMLVPIPAIGIVVGLAWLIAAYVEPAANKLLKRRRPTSPALEPTGS